MVMNGDDFVAAVTVFAKVDVVSVGVCAVARDRWMSINVREVIGSPDLECGMIEDMTNQQPLCHALSSVAAMKIFLGAWVTAVDSN